VKLVAKDRKTFWRSFTLLFDARPNLHAIPSRREMSETSKKSVRRDSLSPQMGPGLRRAVAARVAWIDETASAAQAG